MRAGYGQEDQALDRRSVLPILSAEGPSAVHPHPSCREEGIDCGKGARKLHGPGTMGNRMTKEPLMFFTRKQVCQKIYTLYPAGREWNVPG